jgi:hypothetical protein
VMTPSFDCSEAWPCAAAMSLKIRGRNQFIEAHPVDA